MYDWYCPLPKAGLKLFSDKTRQHNNIYRQKSPPQQYQQRFNNYYLQEGVSDVIDIIIALPTTRSVTQQLLHTIVNYSKFVNLQGTYTAVSSVQRINCHYYKQ